MRTRSFWAFCATAILQSLATLSIEDAMTLPLILGILSPRLRNEKDKRTCGWFGPLMVLALLEVLLLVFMEKPFFASPQSATKVSWNVSLPFQFATLLLQLLGPLFVPYRGVLPARPFPAHIPWLLAPTFVAIFLGWFLCNKERRTSLAQKIPFYFVLMGAAWILLAAMPLILHPDNFAHGNRLMYFPMVGMSLILGVVSSAFLRVSAGLSGRFLLIACAIILLYSLGDRKSVV